MKTRKLKLQSWKVYQVVKGQSNHQGIGWPSQAKNLPLSVRFALSMMLRSFCTENSLVKSLSLAMFFWNAFERSVSTVPGCSKRHIIGSFLRANSTDTFFVTAEKEWILNKELQQIGVWFHLVAQKMAKTMRKWKAQNPSRLGGSY